MSLLQISDLALSVGPVPILRGVSMSVEAGRVLGVIGESGSGKSMTAMAVMGLLPGAFAARGGLWFEGRDLLRASEAEMCALRGAGIGMVFQEPMTALNPVMSIGDQVAETALVHRPRLSRAEALEIAAEALTRAELPPERFPLSRYPHELSGGQRQRVVIAIAIALRPRLLIADEPTTALDVTTQAQILALLKRLVREEGLGLMLITHDLAVVAEMADDLVIMRRGEVVERADAAALARPEGLRHPYSRARRAASGHRPRRPAALSAAPSAAPSAAGPAAPPLLEVEGVVRDYPLPRRRLFAAPGRHRAVDGVSFTLARGESLGLVGESGCGKSTLTRALLGLEPLQAGAIRLNGRAVDAGARPDPGLRRAMQVVFQDPYGSFNPRHRVARLVAEPFHALPDAPQGAARADAVAEALEAVGLRAEDAGKYIHEFSGGQRQRIAIARALITRPEVIVLDEAVSALDVSVRARVLDLLAELQERYALSYLFISHDLTVVRAITDRVMVMQAGRIIEEGPTEAVFAAPRHGYTRALLAAAPRLPGTEAA